MIEQIQSLINARNKEYPLSFSFDFSDNECIYYLYYKNNNIVSALALFTIKENTNINININIYEAIAYTDINFKNMGYFTALYNYLINDLKSDAEISFLCNKNLPQTVHLAQKLSLKYDCSELMMEFCLKDYSSASVKKIFIKGNNNEYNLFYQGRKIGHFFLERFNEDEAYFFGFKILKKYRNQGLGRLSMNFILMFLKEQGINKMHLQVLLENTPAYKIYKNLGFKITGEISYYKRLIR